MPDSPRRSVERPRPSVETDQQPDVCSICLEAVNPERGNPILICTIIFGTISRFVFIHTQSLCNILNIKKGGYCKNAIHVKCAVLIHPHVDSGHTLCPSCRDPIFEKQPRRANVLLLERLASFWSWMGRRRIRRMGFL